MPVILAVTKLRQESQEFEISQGYIERSLIKKVTLFNGTYTND
jgi:hypothetical protein